VIRSPVKRSVAADSTDLNDNGTASPKGILCASSDAIPISSKKKNFESEWDLQKIILVMCLIGSTDVVYYYVIF